MRNLIILAAIGLSLIPGLGPYAAAIVHTMLGTTSVVFGEADGTMRPATIGVGAPQPAWVPVPPGAVIAAAGYFPSTPGRPETGSLDVVTRLALEDLATFYTNALRTSGFNVTDERLGTLNPLTAQALGIDRMMSARNPSSGIELGLSIGTSQGAIIKSRIVQLSWRRS